MIKLKHLLLLKEFWMPGQMTGNSNPSPLSYADGEADELIQHTETSIKQGNPDWFMATGTNNWQDKKAYCSTYVTEGGKPVRIWAEVKTKWLRKPNDTKSSHHDRVRKAITKVSKAWASEAKRIRKEEIVSEIGNHKIRPWKECFTQALKSPKVAPFIMECGVDEASAMDPVNFTPRI